MKILLVGRWPTTTKPREGWRMEFIRFKYLILPLACNSSSGKHSRTADYWGNPKYLGIEKVSIIKVNQGTGNRWTGETGKTDDCKDHPYPDAHFLGIFGQATYAADKETLHSIRKEAVDDDPGKKTIVRSDVLPQVEQHAGTERYRSEDI